MAEQRAPAWLACGYIICGSDANAVPSTSFFLQHTGFCSSICSLKPALHTPPFVGTTSAPRSRAKTSVPFPGGCRSITSSGPDFSGPRAIAFSTSSSSRLVFFGSPVARPPTSFSPSWALFHTFARNRVAVSPPAGVPRKDVTAQPQRIRHGVEAVEEGDKRQGGSAPQDEVRGHLGAAQARIESVVQGGNERDDAARMSGARPTRKTWEKGKGRDGREQSGGTSRIVS